MTRAALTPVFMGEEEDGVPHNGDAPSLLVPFHRLNTGT